MNSIETLESFQISESLDGVSYVVDATREVDAVVACLRKFVSALAAKKVIFPTNERDAKSGIKKKNFGRSALLGVAGGFSDNTRTMISAAHQAEIRYIKVGPTWVGITPANAIPDFCYIACLNPHDSPTAIKIKASHVREMFEYGNKPSASELDDIIYKAYVGTK